MSSLQVIVDTSNLVCGLNIACPNLQIPNSPSNGRGHVTNFNFFCLPKISLERLKLQTSNLLCMMHVDHSKSQPTNGKLSMKGAWSLSRDVFNFWKISDNIWKRVQDSFIVSITIE